jgi:hypothetical protein
MNRRGIALLLAIAALLGLGIVASTGVALGLREIALGRSAMADAKAEAAAEAAVAQGFRGLQPGSIPFLPGDSVAIPVPPLPGALVGRLMLHALGGPIFALRGTGQVMGPAGVLATVRVELLVRLNPAGPDSLMYPRAITRGWRRIP